LFASIDERRNFKPIIFVDHQKSTLEVICVPRSMVQTEWKKRIINFFFKKGGSNNISILRLTGVQPDCGCCWKVDSEIAFRKKKEDEKLNFYWFQFKLADFLTSIFRWNKPTHIDGHINGNINCKLITIHNEKFLNGQMLICLSVHLSDCQISRKTF
jgi:hypothetical protein